MLLRRVNERCDNQRARNADERKCRRTPICRARSGGDGRTRSGVQIECPTRRADADREQREHENIR